MGLPDTSPVPKKDSMGMDYIPVYEGEAQEPGGTIKLGVERIQRSGVRIEPARSVVLTQPVRAVGAVALDERRLTVVAMRSEGYVEDLFVDTTGQTVRKGEPLFRVYSLDIQQALADLLVVSSRGQSAPALAQSSLNGTMRRLRNLGVPEDRIQELRDSGVNPRTIDWPSPASGTIISKRIINGQRITAGDELYRIADLSQVWVIADVAEGDLADIKPSTRATVTFRAYMGEPVEGVVTFIYPEMRAETRTARVRIEVPNPDGRLKTDMYADVVFHVEGTGIPVTAVPSGAVIDSGARQVVLVAKGEGRFEPRPVKLGRRGGGRVEIIEGLTAGEEVVTSATFLIDAESNLQTALKAFTQPEPAK
jgi:Cu(I)/Ag(I) efflux system membrane fusion protein